MNTDRSKWLGLCYLVKIAYHFSKVWQKQSVLLTLLPPMCETWHGRRQLYFHPSPFKRPIRHHVCLLVCFVSCKRFLKRINGICVKGGSHYGANLYVLLYVLYCRNCYRNNYQLYRTVSVINSTGLQSFLGTYSPNKLTNQKIRTAPIVCCLKEKT